uniref:ATP-binding protein n=1 Tax=Desertifilum tharense IPPAS B-1220 TaxID=1781255 RepID=A0ACD5GXN3_9CYAN
MSRTAEVQTLLDAFERTAQGQSELLLVKGFSGIGKTAVINEVHKPIVRQRGYFIKGKFNQFNRNIPFWYFVQAFRELMGQLLGEPDTQLAQWRLKILQALGENAQVMIEAIPDLERIIGKQPPFWNSREVRRKIDSISYFGNLSKFSPPPTIPSSSF